MAPAYHRQCLSQVSTPAVAVAVLGGPVQGGQGQDQDQDQDQGRGDKVESGVVVVHHHPLEDVECLQCQWVVSILAVVVVGMMCVASETVVRIDRGVATSARAVDMVVQRIMTAPTGTERTRNPTFALKGRQT